MEDRRAALVLSAGTELELELSVEPGSKLTLEIAGQIGFGGTGIVYRAHYRQSDAQGFFVVLKEYCPAAGHYERDSTGTLKGQTPEDDKLLQLCAEQSERELALSQLLAEKTQYASAGLFLVDKEQIGGCRGTAANRFFVMHEVRGDSIREILEKSQNRVDPNGGALPNIHRSARLIRSVLRAVQAMHRAAAPNNSVVGYLHLDLKPENILFYGGDAKIDENGIAVLLDFGSAQELYAQQNETLQTKAVTELSLSGSAGFTAPEVFRKEGVSYLTPAADIYSVGRILLYLVTGGSYLTRDGRDELAKWNESLRDEILHGRIRVAAPRCACPPEAADLAAAIVQKAMKIEPEQRYQSAGEMLADVDKLVKLTAPDKVRLRADISALGGFVGRGDELKLMHQMLSSGTKPLLLWGFGGMGKTELAVEYTRRAKVAAPAINTYFVPFEGSLRQTVIGAIARSMSGYSTTDFDGNPKNPEIIYAEVLNILGQYSASDILVIDNVDDESETKDFAALCEGEDGGKAFADLSRLALKLIFTTRSAQPAGEGVEVGTLPRQKLLELARSLHPSGRETDAELLALIDAVESHTLAVDLMARTLENSLTLSAGELLQKLRRDDYESVSLPVETEKDRSLKAKRLSEHIGDLFDVAELRGADKRLFTHALLLRSSGLFAQAMLAAEQSAAKSDTAESVSTEGDEQALHGLIVRGWIRCDKAESGQNVLHLHPLVRHVGWQKLAPAPKDYHAYLNALEDALDVDLSHLLEETPILQLADCLVSAAESCEAAKNDAQLADYAGKAGSCFGALKIFKPARQMLDISLEKYRELAAVDPRMAFRFATALDISAQIYEAVDDMRDAEKNYREALTISRGFDKLDARLQMFRAKLCKDYALLDFSTLSLPQKENLFREAFECMDAFDCEQTVGMTSERAAVYEGYAIFCSERKDFSKADEFYGKAYALLSKACAWLSKACAWLNLPSKKGLTPYVAEMAQVGSNWAALLMEQHRYIEAVPLNAAAEKWYRGACPHNVRFYLPMLARVCSNSAVCFFELKEYQKAEPLYQESLKYYRDLAQKGSERYLSELSSVEWNYAIFCERRVNYPLAEEYYIKSLEDLCALNEKVPGRYLEHLKKRCEDSRKVCETNVHAYAYAWADLQLKILALRAQFHFGAQATPDDDAQVPLEDVEALLRLGAQATPDDDAQVPPEDVEALLSLFL